MKPGQARRRLGKTVYFVSNDGLVAVVIKKVYEVDGVCVADVQVGELVDLTLPVNRLIP